MVGGFTLLVGRRRHARRAARGVPRGGRARLRGQGGLRPRGRAARRPAAPARGAAAQVVALRRRARRAERGVHWVEPDLVAQVEFTEWTDEGRMRQPVFLGLARRPRGAARGARAAGHGRGRRRRHRVRGPALGGARAATPRARAPQSGEEIVELLGVRLTHPDRVYYPDLGFTKLDLALYYVSIADAVLPHLEGRPLTLVRCPDGIGGETFYQKHPGFWTPPQVRRLAVPGESRGVPVRGLGARARGARAGRDPRDPSLELAGRAPRGAGPGDLRPRPRRVAAVLPRRRGGAARARAAPASSASRAS